jgi:hypothetical protein
MHKIVYLVLGVLLAAGAATTGCGGGGNTGGGGAGTTKGAGGGGGGAQALSCDTYCQDQMANCTGSLLQFPDMASCLAVCKSYPTGKSSDMAGDTLGCREYHTTVAGMSAMNAKTHCWHGGPTGGDADNTDTAAGVCGDGCEAFCDLEAVACTGAEQQYASKSACMSACRAFPKPTAASYDVAGASASHDFFCYMYHLTAASTDPKTHCPHTKAGNTPASPCDPTM